MPKLSKRKKQLKDIYSSRKDSDVVQSEPQPPTVADAALGVDVSRAARATAKKANEKEQDGEERPWVQCSQCNKWRALPSSVELESLPEEWSCSLNQWDPARSSCDVPEESYTEVEDVPLKSFFKSWAKRLRTADKVESKLSTSTVTRGKRRKSDVEWIRCSNPSCGKWRSLSVRCVDAITVLRRLNRPAGWTEKPLKWYCAMNTWDEMKASCAAPQEDLFDAPWNLKVTA